MIVPDLDLLIYAYSESSEFHECARAFQRFPGLSWRNPPG